MTAKQKRYRLALLKKIHTHQSYKRIYADGWWEEWLEEKFNARSCKFLSIAQLLDVIALLEGTCPVFFTPSNALGPTQNQIQAVLDLKEALRWNLAQLEGFCQYTCHCTLSALTKAQTTYLILGLRKVLAGLEKKLDKCYTPLNDPNYKTPYAPRGD